MTRELTRRHFLEHGAAAIALPTILRHTTRGRDEVRVAIMGLHSRGKQLAQDLVKIADARITVLCDVDAQTIAPVQAVLRAAGRPEARIETDVRRVVEDPAVDVLVVATPDHWHTPATVLACGHGKDVYCEKPGSHDAHEAELQAEAARTHGRIVQLGTQRRNFPQIVELIASIHAGRIGRAYAARSWYANGREETGRRTAVDVPSWLDWELWQGPAPRDPFTENLVHYKWHWFWQWGTGELGNNGVHALDLCRWALQVDHPQRVVSSGGRYHFADDQETPDTQLVSYEFADGKHVSWEGLSCNRRGIDGTGFGATILGTEGSITIGAREWVQYDASNKEVERAAIATSTVPHLEDFLNAVRTRKAPAADIADLHKSSLLCHLGNIAQRTGHVLRCDPRTGHVLNDAAAQALWGRDYAKGWEPRV
ncbi:MAG: Gfo/Idh/MocA family oxidoreductase [Planctomycetes bacterium]|nr:Gfo/Idh/MocA family oxidoreductase [Planctomycetota bacterium]